MSVTLFFRSTGHFSTPIVRFGAGSSTFHKLFSETFLLKRRMCFTECCKSFVNVPKKYSAWFFSLVGSCSISSSISGSTTIELPYRPQLSSYEEIIRKTQRLKFISMMELPQECTFLNFKEVHLLNRIPFLMTYSMFHSFGCHP